jgi:hypothetical protein
MDDALLAGKKNTRTDVIQRGGENTRIYVCKNYNITVVYSIVDIQISLALKLEKYISSEKLSEEYINKLLMLI